MTNELLSLAPSRITVEYSEGDNSLLFIFKKSDWKVYFEYFFEKENGEDEAIFKVKMTKTQDYFFGGTLEEAIEKLSKVIIENTRKVEREYELSH